MQSIGVCLFVSIAIFILWYAPVIRSKQQSGAGVLSFFAAGFALPLLSVLFVFYLSGSLPAFLYACFVWPFSHYRVINLATPGDVLTLWMRELSDNGIVLGTVYGLGAFAAILVSLAPVLYAVCRTRARINPDLSAITFVSVFCAGLVAGLLPNPTAFHLMVFSPVFLLAGITILDYPLWWRSRWTRPVVYSYLVMIMLAVSLNSYRFFSASGRPANALVTLKTPAGSVRMYRNYVSLPALSYPYAVLKDPSLKLPRHVFVVYWSPAVYVLTGTDNPTPLNTYMPLYNSRAQTQAVLSALRADHTKVVIMDNAMSFVRGRIGWLIHDSQVFSPDNPVAAYINRHYRIEATIPGYTIYRLRDH